MERPEPPQEESEHVTYKQAAALRGVHLSAIYQAIQDGRLTPVRVLEHNVLRREQVKSYPVRPNRKRKAAGSPPEPAPPDNEKRPPS